MAVTPTRYATDNSDLHEMNVSADIIATDSGTISVNSALIQADTTIIAGDTTSLNTKTGEVQATPTANTVLGRLKDIADNVTSSMDLTTVETNTGTTAVNTGLLVTDTGIIAGDTTSIDTKLGEVQATPTANTVLDRLKTIGTDTTTIAGDTTAIEVDTGLLVIDTGTIVTNTGTIAGDTTAMAADTGLLLVDTGLIIVDTGTIAGDTTIIAGDTTSLDTKMGEVQATPTANTVLGRLKDISDNITLTVDLSTVETNTGTTATNTGLLVTDTGLLLVDTGTIVTNTGTTATNTENLDTKLGEVQATPTANTVLDRLKTIGTDTTTISGSTTAIAVDTGTIAGDTTAMLIDTGLLVIDTGLLVVDTGTIAGDTTALAADMVTLVASTATIETSSGIVASNIVTVVTNTGTTVTNTGTTATNTGTTASNTATTVTNTGTIATNTGNINTKTGEVQASPTANTILGRLKDLTTSTLNVAEKHLSLGGFFPEPGTLSTATEIGELVDFNVDSRGNLSTRGAITTDEGSFREDFSGTEIYYVETGGDVTFTNGSRTITGLTTDFTDGSEAYGDYIKLGTDADTHYAKIESVITDLEILLESAYTGTSGTGPAHHAMFKPVIGTGGSMTVGSSLLNILSGTTASALTKISRNIDYCPLVLTCSVIISQRIANQNGYIGFTDDVTTPNKSSYFLFDGTSNLAVKCVSQYSSAVAETQTTTVAMLLSTATSRRYRIEVMQEYVAFYIDDLIVATHRDHLPGPYAYMDAIFGWSNGATPPASTSTMSVDSIFVGNIDVVQVSNGLVNLPVVIGNTSLLPAYISNSKFEISLEITRPDNSTDYSANDIVNNDGSTTLPVFDFSALGNLQNRFIEVTNIVIISSQGTIGTKMIPYIHLFNDDVITGTDLTDNLAFNPSYAEMIAKRVLTVEPTFTTVDHGTGCYLLTAAEKVRIFKLDATCKVYLALIMTNAYNPANLEKITVILKGNL